MSDLTKAEKRSVRELLSEAFEANLRPCSKASNQQWPSGGVANFVRVKSKSEFHEFHKESQEIFKIYNNVQPLLAPARAVEFEFIPMARVPESLRERHEPLRALVR